MRILHAIVRLPSKLRALWVIGFSRQFDRVYYRDFYEDRGSWVRRVPLLHYVFRGAALGLSPASRHDPDISGTPLDRGEGGGNLDAFLAFILRSTDYPLYLSLAGLARKQILLAARAINLRRNRSAYRALIEQWGGFDADYYANTYGDAPRDPAAALDHYMHVGLAEGRYPNDGFDPIGYLLRHADAARSPLPPLVHFLKIGQAEGRTAPHGLDGVLPGYLPESHHKIQTNFRRKGKPKSGDRGRIPVHIRSHAGGCWSYWITEDGSRVVHVRPPTWYFDRIARGEPLTFVKRTHGTWDMTATWLDNQERLVNLPLSPEQRMHLATRLSYYRADAMRREVVKYIYVENFQNELVHDMMNPAVDPGYCHAISLAALSVTKRDLFFKFYSPEYVSKLRGVVAGLLAEGEYHDATMWKRSIGTGEILKLNEHLRTRPVYFVGLEHYGELGKRLDWEDFTHVEIPASGTMAMRATVLDRLRKQLEDRFGSDPGANPSGRPVVLICAGNVAQWLAHRLHLRYPGGVYLDVGMIYSLWIVDIYPTVHGWIKDLPADLYEPMRILPALRRAPEDIKERYRRWTKHEI